MGDAGSLRWSAAANGGAADGHVASRWPPKIPPNVASTSLAGVRDAGERDAPARRG